MEEAQTKYRKDFEKVIGYLAEAAVKMAQEDLSPELVPDLSDALPYVRDALDKIEPAVRALMEVAEQNRLDGEGVHPKNFFPDALARTIRRRINAV